MKQKRGLLDTVCSLNIDTDSNVGEGGVAVNCEKNTIFLEHPVLQLESYQKDEQG